MFFDTQDAKAIAAREERAKELDAMINEFNYLARRYPPTLEKLIGSQPNDAKLDTCPVFKKIYSDPKYPELKESLAKASADEPISLFQFINAMMKFWFTAEARLLKISGQFPADGHDVRNDYVLFAEMLAEEMLKQNLKRFSPENKKIWDKYILNKNKDFKDEVNFKHCLKACPLKKSGDSYEFIRSEIADNFSASASIRHIKSDRVRNAIDKLKQSAAKQAAQRK